MIYLVSLVAFVAGGTFGLLAAALLFAAREFIDDNDADEFTLKDVD